MSLMTSLTKSHNVSLYTIINLLKSYELKQLLNILLLCEQLSPREYRCKLAFSNLIQNIILILI